MRMDHDVDVRDRLDFDDYAISPVDALLAKLQIGKINQKDVHDVIALVKDVPLREADAEGELEISLDVGYLAEVCSQDWGLYHDITTNLDARPCLGGGLRACGRRACACPRAPDHHQRDAAAAPARRSPGSCAPRSASASPGAARSRIPRAPP